MPIFEFKCMDCEAFIESLIMKKEDEVEMKCEKCGSHNLERVLSTTSHTVSSGGAASGASTQSRTCSSGSCTTYTIPGPA
ncbi:zinc ribbon domain-containing protein [Desulfosarcina sp. OttesenSCG-928-G17]|nr:zinc ribbon domain-containing protein [Desulfosarcina sp. OttesenSCG-928-G17]